MRQRAATAQTTSCSRRDAEVELLIYVPYCYVASYIDIKKVEYLYCSVGRIRRSSEFQHDLHERLALRCIKAAHQLGHPFVVIG